MTAGIAARCAVTSDSRKNVNEKASLSRTSAIRFAIAFMAAQLLLALWALTQVILEEDGFGLRKRAQDVCPDRIVRQSAIVLFGIGGESYIIVRHDRSLSG